MNFRRIALAAATALMPLAPAIAANINWTTGPAFNGPNGHLGILTNGALVEAVNLRGSAGPDIVVDPAGLNISFSAVNSASFNNTFGGAGGAGNTDAGWATIISAFEWQAGSNVSAANFLAGLTVGSDYQVQFFASRGDGCCRRTHWYGDGNGNLSTPKGDQSYVSVVGTFTADAASQTIEFFDSTRNPYLNAYVLRDITPVVPEPGTYALMLAGLAAIAGVARRRHG